MITREQALTANYFHENGCSRKVGPRGGVTERIIQVRRNGSTQTWKTRPEDFRVPVKYGMYQYGEIAPWNSAHFHTPEDCPIQGA